MNGIHQEDASITDEKINIKDLNDKNVEGD